MKKSIIILFVFLFSGNVFAQDNTQDRGDIEQLSIIIKAGYIPKSSYNAFSQSIAVNNLLYKRIGFYTTLQFGLDSDYFSNIWGITGTVHEKIYLYAGMDLFTKRGFINRQFGARKHLGVGFIPHPNIVIHADYAISQGFLFGAGIRIPLAWVPGDNQ